MKDMFTIIPEFIEAVQKKDLSKLADIVTKAEAAYSDCTGKPIPENAPKCINDIVDLAPQIRDAIHSKDPTKAMAIFGKIMTAYNDCKDVKPPREQNLRDMPSCVADLVDLIPEVVEAVKNEDTSKIFDIVVKAKKAYDDCVPKTNRRKLLFVSPLKSTPDTCVAAVYDVLPEVTGYLMHLKNMDWSLARWKQELPRLEEIGQEIKKSCVPVVVTARERGTCPCNNVLEKYEAQFRLWYMHYGHRDWSYSQWAEQMPQMLEAAWAVWRNCRI